MSPRLGTVVLAAALALSPTVVQPATAQAKTSRTTGNGSGATARKPSFPAPR